MAANPFNVGQAATQDAATVPTTLEQNPFNLAGLPTLGGTAASSPAGIAYNTVVGLPQAAGKVLKDTGQAIARDFFGVGLSLSNAINTFMGRDITTSYTPTNNISKAILGETTNDLATRVAQTEQAIKDSPIAQKFGLDKQAGPLAFGGVIGSVALDFTGAGGEENIAKQLLKEGTEEGAAKLLTKIEVPATVIKEFAPRFAIATQPEEVKALMSLMHGAVGAESVAKESATVAASAGRPGATPSEGQLPGIGESPALGNRLATPATTVGEKTSLESTIAQNPFNSNPAPEDHVAAFTQALKDAKPLRAEQEALYTETRAKRIADVQATQKTTTGEAGFLAEKGKLAGEMPKVQYESLRKSMNQDQVDSLFNMVRDSPNLDSFETITARNGLTKMFDGSVPTEGEIKLLSRVLPPETIDTMLSKRSLLTKLGEGALDVINVPRAVMSSADMSAPFRQGLFMSGRKEFRQAFGTMLKDFASEDAFKASQENIFQRPSYQMMKDAKLAIMDDGAQLSGREERFTSNLAEKIPVAGRVVRASSRAYTGFLNKLRADVFDDLISKARQSNIPLTDKRIADLGKYINSATGRGSIAGLDRTAQVLNSVLFSPRLAMSRINLLNPMFYYKLDPFVRKEALKDLFRSTSMAGTVLTLAAAGGATVNTNATNADFGKVKIGDTRIDILGGFQQYIRLAAQLITGKIQSSTTGKTLDLGVGYKPLTRLDILERFFQGKENPIASFVTDFLQGQDLVGNKFKLGPEILQRVVPMLAQDVTDVLKDGGFMKAVGVGTLGAFGFGTQTYKAGNTKTKANPFNI